MTLLALAAVRRAAVAPGSRRYRLIHVSPAHRVHGSKPAFVEYSGRQMGQTEGQTDIVPFYGPCRLLCE